MAEEYIWSVTAEQVGKRLDVVLAEEMDISRSTAQQWLEQGLVTTHGKVLNKKDKLKEGTEVCVVVPEPVTYDIVAEDIALDIVFQLIVIQMGNGKIRGDQAVEPFLGDVPRAQREGLATMRRNGDGLKQQDQQQTNRKKPYLEKTFHKRMLLF